MEIENPALAIGELHIADEPDEVSLNEITALLYYINGIAEGLADSETTDEIAREFAQNERQRSQIVNDTEVRERIIGRLAQGGDLKRITSTKGRYLGNSREGAVKVTKIRKESPFLVDIIGPLNLVFIVLYLGAGVRYEYTETIHEDGSTRIERKFEFNPPNLQEALEALRKLF